MSNNRRKHKILKALKKKLNDNMSSHGLIESYQAISLYPKELSKATGIHINLLLDICSILLVEGLIESVNSGNVNLNDKYRITHKGIRSFTDKKHLNQIIWRKFDFWKFAIPLIIGIIALLNSIFRWWETS